MDADPAARATASTPPRQPQQQQNTKQKNTPRRAVNTATKEYSDYTTDNQRKMLLTDLGPNVPCANLEVFETFLLPPLAKSDREAVFKHLQENGSFSEADPNNSKSTNRWTSLPFVPTASGAFAGKEADLYAAFESTCEDILKAAEAVRGAPALGEVRDTATYSWVSETPKNKFRSDCDMVRLKIGKEDAYSLSNNRKQPDAANVIVNMEFKMSKNDRAADDVSNRCFKVFQGPL